MSATDEKEEEIEKKVKKEFRVAGDAIRMEIIKVEKVG